MSDKIKTIGIVNAYNETAGPFTVLKTFLKHFDDVDYRIVLFIPKGEQQIEFNNPNIKVVFTDTVPIDKDIFSVKAIIYSFRVIAAWLKFIYYLKKDKVDVLHNNSSNLFVQSVAAWFCKVPVIYHVREIWNTRSRFSRMLYSFISKISAKIVCITEAVKKMNFSEKEQIKFAEKFTVVYDCIDDIFLESTILPKNDNRIIITYLGRIAPIKGVDILLKAFSIVLNQEPSFSVCLRIVGDVPKNNSFYNNYKRTVYELANECIKNNSLSVKFLGFRKDVLNLLAESHLLILPSRIEEGLGLVLAEAAVADNYLITSNLGGQKEIIEMLNCGDLFENENSLDLALKIQKFITQRNNYDTCILTAKMNAKKIFSPQVYKNKVVAIYENVCAPC